jgi:hypothetical protein
VKLHAFMTTHELAGPEFSGPLGRRCCLGGSESAAGRRTVGGALVAAGARA